MMKLFLNFAFAFTCGVIVGGILVTWAELGPIPDWLLKEIMPKAKVNWDEAYEVKLLPVNEVKPDEVKPEWKPKLLPPKAKVNWDEAYEVKPLPVNEVKSVVKPQIKNEWEPKWLPFKKKGDEVKPEVKNEWKPKWLPPKKKRRPEPPDLWPIFRDYPMMSHNF